MLELPLVTQTEIPQAITDTLAKIAPIFESEKEIYTPQKDGSVTKSTVKVKSQFKKDQQGKPYLDTNFETKQPDVKATEKTTNKSSEVKQKFSIDTFKPFMRIITIIIVLMVVVFLFKDKIFKR
jgi:flagellar biosynthesis/type III secretory pathway M-ring protein FliF/YscJ